MTKRVVSHRGVGVRRSLAAILAGLGALLVTAEASAYERQWHAGAMFGPTYLGGGDQGYAGLGGGLHLTYGLTDAFNLIGEVEVMAHPAGHFMLNTVSVGAEYVIDILTVVPYVGATIGPADLWSYDPTCGSGGSGFSCHRGKLALGIPFGLDYQLSRSFALGLEGRYRMFVIRDTPLSSIGGGIHAELIWGY